MINWNGPGCKSESSTVEIKVWNKAISIIFCNNYNQTNLFLEQILILIFLKKPCGVFPPFKNVGEKTRGVFEKTHVFF